MGMKLSLSDVSLNDLQAIILKLKKINNVPTFEDAIDSLVTFLPNITFREFMMLKIIIKDFDSIKYEDFLKSHNHLEYDPTGTSPSNIKFWEPLLELKDAEVKMYQTLENPPSMAKREIEAKTLNHVSALKATNIPSYFMLRKVYLQKISHNFPYYSARLQKVEAGLKKLVQKPDEILARILFYCYKTKSDKLLGCILNRLEFLIQDTDLKHPSNIEYLNKLKNFENN